jgi:stearoyl-CoA desaturase (delta-9 desaturase)
MASVSGRVQGLRAKPAAGLVRAPRLHAVSSRAPARLITCQAARDNTRTSAAAAEPLTLEQGATGEITVPEWAGMSYDAQYDDIFSKPLNLRKVTPKPDPEAQAQVPGARPVPFSDVYAKPKSRLFFNREFTAKDKMYMGYMAFIHIGALAAPFFFSWANVAEFLLMYFITGCLGITLSYHRQLTHRSFTTPKWLERVLAYCGVMAVQGDPLEWVSCHRYHHLHCETPLDPHSVYEGFWWSHMGWLLDDRATQSRVHDTSNATDISRDPFYAHLSKHYGLHVVGMFVAIFLLGGLDSLLWAGCLRCAWVYHITWFVNSAAHVWGTQEYETGDQSRNNWWVGLLAFGEGWHNNHHAFEFSARHGLKDSQWDMTWQVIRFLNWLGLADNVKLPTERQLERLRLPNAAA